MNQKYQYKHITTDSNKINNDIKISNRNLQKNQGNNKNKNRKARFNFINQKNKQVKNNFKTGNHYTSSNNNDKSFNNTFYKNKNDYNNKNILNKENKGNYNKVVVDMKESIKYARNTSAPVLKQNNINKNKNQKNYVFHNKNFNLNQKKQNGQDNSINNNINKIKIKDISYDKTNNNNNNKNKPIISINNRINRINNLKQKYISNINNKNFEKYNNYEYLNKKKYLLNNTNNDINNPILTERIKYKKQIKETENDNIINRDILATQEKIAILKKKLKEGSTDMGGNTDLNNYTYNNITSNNNNLDNEKHITIDNEEKIINIDGNSIDENENKDSINNNENKMYRDITPDKKINYSKYNNSYINNFDSIETNDNYGDKTNSKFGSSYIKGNTKPNKFKKIKKEGYTYNKPSDHIRKINIPKTDREKDLFKNNFNLYNRNIIHTERPKYANKKSKKINININLKTNDNNEYYYTKSSNIFNTVNNKLNKSSIIPNNKNKEKKILNKTQLNVNTNNIKKNKSVRKTRIKTDLYNNNTNNIINKIIGKRNSDNTKLPYKKQHNKSINYTYEKINSSKNKKHLPKVKNPEKKEKIKNKELKKETKKELINEKKINNEKEKEMTNEIENEKDNKQEKENEKEYYIENESNSVDKNIRKIEKIGVVCHAGEVSFGKPKINQDNFFNYNINSDDLVFVGVCDGHGENGHHVSEYLINHLPSDFQEAYINLINNENQFEEIPLEIIRKIFEESFLKTDNDLNEFCETMNNKKLMGEYIPNYFNCDYSGSTCVSLLLKHKNISSVYIANVGDSRVIVVRENENNIWNFEQLSRDHKPTEEDEYARIIEADGEIEAIEDDNGNWTGPLRVWEKGSEGPGLAMTRSLGDKVGTKIGVICTPEVFKYNIKDEDRAFIIASDGLWEYMPNQEVTEAVKEIILDMRENNEVSADIIANELFKQAVIRWRQKEPGMDDITIICVLLNQK